MNKNYDIMLTLKKGVKYLVLFGIPKIIDMFIMAYPEYAQLGLGAGLVMFANYMKHGYEK